MKEASGELNMTLVIVIAVAALAAFFYTIIWPSVSNNFHSNADCNDAICECNEADNKCEMAECYLANDKNNKFKCPWKG